MDIAIIGGGGLGANLAILLGEQGHDVIVVDHDIAGDADFRFFKRFTSFSGSRRLMKGARKVDIINSVAKARKLKVAGVFATFNERFNLDIIRGRLVIICTDSAGSREMIEILLKDAGFSYFHVGCNLNSISIWKTMDTVFATDDPNPDRQSSYDVVPDAKTFWRAAVAVAEILDKDVSVYQEPVLNKKPEIPDNARPSDLDMLLARED